VRVGWSDNPDNVFKDDTTIRFDTDNNKNLQLTYHSSGEPISGSIEGIAPCAIASTLQEMEEERATSRFYCNYWPNEAGTDFCSKIEKNVPEYVEGEVEVQGKGKDGIIFNEKEYNLFYDTSYAKDRRVVLYKPNTKNVCFVPVIKNDGIWKDERCDTPNEKGVDDDCLRANNINVIPEC
jgi:hypothetical protein